VPSVRLYLVRHAEVTVRPDRPGHEWHLSPGGRAAAEALGGAPYWAGVRGLHTSCEPKAEATAQRIASANGLQVRIEHDLREVEGRGWSEDYREQARRYLAGEAVESWEPRDDALARVRACIDRIVQRHADLEVGIVAHGLVLALYLTELLELDGNASYKLWSDMRFPDVAVVDPEARRLERPFGSS